MYLVIEDNEAIIIDPHKNNDLFSLLDKQGVSKVKILLTHEHPDHISGIYDFQQKYDCTIICTKNCAEYISEEKNTRPILISFVLEERDRKLGTHFLDKFNKEYVAHTYNADITFDNKYEFNWDSHSFKMFTIQGHSKGGCGIILDEKFVFTGDSVLKEHPIITRFPGGSTKVFKEITLPLLESMLKPDMQIFPGHGKPFLLSEIMKDGKINVELR